MLAVPIAGLGLKGMQIWPSLLDWQMLLRTAGLGVHTFSNFIPDGQQSALAPARAGPAA